MKNLDRLTLTVSFLLAGLCSCSTSQVGGRMDEAYGGTWGKERVTSPMKTIGAIAGVPTYGSPYPLPGRESWISSFAFTLEDTWFRDSDAFSEGGLAGKSRARGAAGNDLQLIPLDVRWHNANFCDRSQNEHWSLLDQRAFISRWWLVLETVAEKRVTERLLFAVTLDDTSGDGLLDNRDAAVVVMTDGNGRHARRITPANAQLSTVRLFPERRMLGFDLRFDDDGNGKYEKDEPTQLHYLPLEAEPPTVQPWKNADFRESLEALYR